MFGLDIDCDLRRFGATRWSEALDEPIPYVLTEQAREYLAELERGEALGLERVWPGDDS